MVGPEHNKMKGAFIDKLTHRTHCNSQEEFELFNINQAIITGLKEFSDVAVYNMLSDRTYQGIREESSRGYFQYIITHVPVDMDLFDRTVKRENPSPLDQYRMYRTSLDLLKQIKKDCPQTNLIAYTGATEKSIPDKVLRENGISGIFRKVDINEKNSGSVVQEIIRLVKS
jgi:hypothetical protein